MSYSALDPEKILSTATVLERRIRERFPDSSLEGVARELVKIAAETKASLSEKSIGQYLLRAFVVGGVALTVCFVVIVFNHLSAQHAPENWSDTLQALDAGANDIVVIGAAIFFLMTLENRVRRPRVLRQLHELRSLAHVIDMHQLTKDPERMQTGGQPTESSPARDLTSFELCRYLDYCSEMLSLVGKIAALRGREVQDQVVLSAIDEVESLTTGLARKVWQKIMIVLLERGAGEAAL